MRLKYPNSMVEEELITSLTKVGLAILTENYITRKYNPCNLFFFVVIFQFILYKQKIDDLAQFVSILKSSFLENFLFKFQFARTNKKPNGNSSLLSFSL